LQRFHLLSQILFHCHQIGKKGEGAGERLMRHYSLLLRQLIGLLDIHPVALARRYRHRRYERHRKPALDTVKR